MLGKVRNVKFGYAFVRGEDGGVYFCHITQMPMDEVGRRYLLPGEKVSFTPFNDKRSPQARNVEVLEPRPPVDANGYEEEGAVKNVEVGGRYCFVLRPYGGVAQLHWRNVLGCDQVDCDNRPVFAEGQRWRFSIAPPRECTNPPRPWLAVRAVQQPSQE